MSTMRCSVVLMFLVLLHQEVALETNVSSVQLAVEATSGAFTVSIDQTTWFTSGPVAVHLNGAWASTEDGSLTLQTHRVYNGYDAWGRLSATELTWKAKGGVMFYTVYKEYLEVPAVAFEQIYPDGAVNTSVGGPLMSSFPTVNINGVEKDQKGYLTYSDNVAAHVSVGDWSNAELIPGGGPGGFPLVVFDRKTKTAVVMSPASQFMAASQGVWKGMNGHNYLGFGLLGSITQIPLEFHYETVFYVGAGTNAAMENWGKLMMLRYGKDDSFRQADFSINYVGYWTDNGACYYYDSDKDNYENTLIAVKNYADDVGLPFRYLQIDSWWYFKGNANGVKNWTAMPDVFPRGIEYLHNMTSWPIFAHNRYWSTNTDYAKQNGGQFDFIVESNAALPVSAEFWDYLISSSKREWNLFVYEQDWLDTEFNTLKALQENATLGRMWLRQMGQAAQKYGLTIQYCMPYPRHLLQSLEVPAVTQTRASNDYTAGNTQWRIGDTSILNHAVGLAPFKDNFFTNSTQPAGCHSTHQEPYPLLQAVVATYSTGPVGPSDHIDAVDKTIVMQTCTLDGQILKPTKPMRTIDRSFIQRAFGSGGPSGEVWTTHSQVSGLHWHHVFAADLVSEFSFSPNDLLDFHPPTQSPTSWVAYPHNMSSNPIPFDQSHPIKLPVCGRADFGLWHIAPMLENGWFLLGELDKFVPVSQQRIISIATTNIEIQVELAGVPGEQVSISFWNPSSSASGGKVMKHACIISGGGLVTLAAPEGTCS
ncbi:uncharacterized protein LOC134180364 [Corticium candelabrum]|uniref:uncharacterized protein LOC134180364 n=1 Tax=Corticium candelabrum TaxID=121492 RepID=UPI002E274B19|nr:uncharacterized protein LOC134180364 [Corticium candelabrum]